MHIREARTAFVSALFFVLVACGSTPPPSSSPADAGVVATSDAGVVTTSDATTSPADAAPDSGPTAPDAAPDPGSPPADLTQAVPAAGAVSGGGYQAEVQLGHPAQKNLFGDGTHSGRIDTAIAR